MRSDAEPWDPGDPHGLQLVRRSLLWIAAIMAIWATARVLMLGDRFLVYFIISATFFILAFITEPIVSAFKRRREPF